MTCPDSVSVGTDSGEASAVVTWSPMVTVSDNVDSLDISNVSCKDGGGAIVMSEGFFAVGATSVTCNATDSAGNEGSCQFSITVSGVHVQDFSQVFAFLK